MDTRKNNVVPCGIEILVKKAAVDSKFRSILIEERADAASRIKLKLDPSEVMMLNGIPGKQLRAIIKSTKVAKKHRTVFLGYAAAAMLATLGISVGCGQADDEIEVETPKSESDDNSFAEGYSSNYYNNYMAVCEGIRPYTDVVEEPVGEGGLSYQITFKCEYISNSKSNDIIRSSESINEELQQYLKDIEEFYISEVQYDDNLSSGKILTRLSIKSNGLVYGVSLISNSTGSPEFALSMLKRIIKWKFSSASDDVIIEIPFEFDLIRIEDE